MAAALLFDPTAMASVPLLIAAKPKDVAPFSSEREALPMAIEPVLVALAVAPTAVESCPYALEDSPIATAPSPVAEPPPALYESERAAPE